MLLLLAGLAAPAGAFTTVGRFDAHVGVFAPDTGFGIAESGSEAAAFGVPIFLKDSLVVGEPQPPGTARLFALQDSQVTVTLSNVDAAAGTATASYTVILSQDFLDERLSPDELVYLFFATSQDVIVDGVVVSYDSSDVGLVIDSEDPRSAIMQTAASGLDIFYPAVLLPNGGTGDSLVLFFDILGGLQVVDGVAVVPDLLTGGAYVTIIPEPATAALMTLGLLGLAFAGRRL